MGQVKVIVQVITDLNRRPVELPDDVPMKELIPALVTKLNLPKTQPLYLGELYSASPDIPIPYVLDHRQTGRLKCTPKAGQPGY